jgi:hypothetical protein
VYQALLGVMEEAGIFHFSCPSTDTFANKISFQLNSLTRATRIWLRTLDSERRKGHKFFPKLVIFGNKNQKIQRGHRYPVRETFYARGSNVHLHSDCTNSETWLVHSHLTSSRASYFRQTHRLKWYLKERTTLHFLNISVA